MTMTAGSLFPAAFALGVALAGAALPLGTAHAGGAARGAQAAVLPDAPGKALVEQVCATCHGVDLLVPSTRTATQWRDTIGAMKTAGAKASDEEWKAINEYIMGNLAYLNVNKATAEDVRLVFSVADKVAQALVAYRDKQGGFKTLDDLKQVPDVDPKRVDALKERLTF
ncbi:MAG: helix-hairpin-helix domain-containing protein [Acidobacteria bacterium]|nr:helix-hairpin-helix domain-containing protein [Acidobacteriota bacterium]